MTVFAGIDPAWFSLVNTFMIVGVSFYLKNEVATLIRRNDVLSAECARLAQGSEERAKNAAAEITASKKLVEDAAVRINVIGKAVRDELRLVHSKSEKIDEMSRSWPHPGPKSEGPR